MEWVVVGLVVWWWCASRSTAKARAAQHAAPRADQRAAESSLEQLLAASPQRGPWVMPGIVIAIAEGYAYWRADGHLVRAPWHDGCADLDRIEPADPLACDDLPPALVVEVLDALDEAEHDIRHPRTHL